MIYINIIRIGIFIKISEGQEKKKSSDLEGLETSYFGAFAAHKNLYSSYNPTVYFSINPLSFIPPSSKFPTST